MTCKLRYVDGDYVTELFIGTTSDIVGLGPLMRTAKRSLDTLHVTCDDAVVVDIMVDDKVIQTVTV